MHHVTAMCSVFTYRLRLLFSWRWLILFSWPVFRWCHYWSLVSLLEIGVPRSWNTWTGHFIPPGSRILFCMLSVAGQLFAAEGSWVLWSVCLCVGDHISGTTPSISTSFCVGLFCGRALVPLWRRCEMLCTSGFTDDMFSDNWHYGGMSIPLQRRRCSLLRRLTPLLLGVGCILS